MIPDPLDKPAAQAAAVEHLAGGGTQIDLARKLDIDPATVCRFAAANADDIDERRRALRLVAFEEAERSSMFGNATRARLEDACTAPGVSKTAPQSYRTVAEVLGVIGSGGNLTINGDVDASSTVNVDARSVQLVQGADLRAVRDASAEMRSRLGLG